MTDISLSSQHIYRFDQIAQNISERIEPSDADTDIYVGLEHLDPESLHIRRWGTPADVEGTKLRFYKGDVIFGKRRAYQRKLAIAEFDGICSAHAMVLRAKPDVTLPEFLPFFLQSDVFFERALAISKGSLSPTINWSDLARQKFPLPPLDEQHRIAEILWAADEAEQSYVNALASLETATNVISYDLFNSGLNHYEFSDSQIGRIPTNWKLCEMQEVTRSMNNGFVGKAVQHYVDEGIPYLQSNNVRENRIDLDNLVHISEEFHLANTRSQLHTGDLLTVQSGHVGATVVVPQGLDNTNCHALIISRPKPDLMDSYFLAYYINSTFGRKRLSELYIGTTVAHINTSDFRRFIIPVPSIEEQQQIVDLCRTLHQRLQAMKELIVQSRQVKRNLQEHLLT